jgi:solute carrier family 40 (iron-regulated transporter), member 1
VAGPLLAGFLILIPATDEQTSFIIVAIFNFVTFLPQYFLLTMVYDANEHLRAPKEQPPSNADSVSRSALAEWWHGEWNPIMNLYNSWDLFMMQPINYLSISFAFLWLTILSPHDVVFTAYLKSQGYTDWELGVFRGVGALFGVASTVAFPWFVEKYGLQWASFIYIFEEAAMVIGASVIFTLNLKAETQILRFAFLGFILLSRCGLYGFEVGEIQMLQIGIPENVRGRVNSVESSLTSLASLAVFVAGLAFNNPKQFIYLCWGSAAFVALGAFIYLKWNATWKLVLGPHKHSKGADSDHAPHARQLGSDEESIEHDHARFERR